MIWSIKMNKKIILLGDSIIDNKSYVLNNELDVTEHLKKLFSYDPHIAIENHAVDGDTMYQLERDHLDSNLLSGATHMTFIAEAVQRERNGVSRLEDQRSLEVLKLKLETVECRYN